jgi:DNA invertase Pin-like site-specific DNA recombinase
VRPRPTGWPGSCLCDLPEIVATTSAGRLILYVMASMAEFESRRISERTLEPIAQARARGGRSRLAHGYGLCTYNASST